MSVLERLPKSGCLLYGIVLLWMGVLLGIPAIIWDSSAVNMSGLAGAVAAMIIPVMMGQFEISFVKNYPLTTLHICYVIVFCIALTIQIIKGEDAELFIGVMFGVVALLISFIMDNVYYSKDNNKKS